MFSKTRMDILLPMEREEKGERDGLGPGWRSRVVKEGGKPHVLSHDPSP